MLQIRHHGADHGHAHAVRLQDDVGLRRHQLALGVHDIGADDRVVRDVDELLRGLPAVIELVIAQRGGVETEQVRDLVDRDAVKNGGDRRALHQVAGIEQQAGVAVFALVADSGCKLGEAALAALR